MAEPVVKLINGRGHRILKARDVGLEAEDDQTLAEYALTNDLIVVTFDRDLRDSSIRSGCTCMHVRAPERTARQRGAAAYESICDALAARRRLVTRKADGAVVASD